MLATLPLYFGFLGTAFVLLVVGLALYIRITPYHELRLIRQGNRAAAFSLGGTAIALAIILHGVGSNTWRVDELAAWGAIGLLIQILTFFVVARLLPDFKAGILEDKLAYGIALGSFSIAAGILNAGALSS